MFCYGFYAFGPSKGGYKHPPGATARRGPGTGDQYRLIAAGPGVTPNVEAIVPGLHPFDSKSPDDVTYEQQQSRLLASYGDTSCHAGH